MSKPTPIFATSKTAAALLDMKQPEFKKLVDEGVLPKPQDIGGYKRWATAELAAIVRGERIDAYDDVAWK